MKPVRDGLFGVLAAVALAFPMAVGAATTDTSSLNLADLSALVDHPLVPLTSVP
jgi:hypothetical protein